MSQPPTAANEYRWLLEEWESGLAMAIESMGAERPQVSEGQHTEVAAYANARSLYYDLNLLGGPALAIDAQDEAWKDIALRALTAVGLEESNDQLLLETYQELVGQAVSRVAPLLSARLKKEAVFAANANAGGSFDTGLSYRVEVSFGAAAPLRLRVRMSCALLNTLAAQTVAIADGSLQDLRTLENLEMNVTVSLGTVRLTLAEALALGPGSLVRLDPRLDDPVVVKVDEKVVALGEVVAVDGSYAIRLTRLVPAQSRL